MYSDLNGCITDITLAFPKGLMVTDGDVSFILSTAQKKCKLQFSIEGVYKYKDWAKLEVLRKPCSTDMVIVVHDSVRSTMLSLCYV